MTRSTRGVRLPGTMGPGTANQTSRRPDGEKRAETFDSVG